MAVFTYTPDKNFGEVTTPRIREVQFGDGYSQRVGLSQNTFNKVWNLTFNNRKLTDAQAMVAFFETHAGATSFDFTPTDGTLHKVICKSWNVTWVAPQIRSVTAQFTRVFE
jgi:phage-related protein